VPLLWELHKVHHSATFLNPLTTKRMHPLGDMFDGLVAAIFHAAPIGLVMHLYRMNILDAFLLSDTAYVIGSILVLDALRHSHFPISFGIFDRILLSPHAHQLHHSYKVEHWDKNFGNRLSIWDWCFGTMAAPNKGEQFPYGLGKTEDQDYNTIYGAYLGPMVKIARLWRGVPSWHDPSKPSPPRMPLFERLFWRTPTRATYPRRIQENLEAKRPAQN
jgi:sterol desaturase/sphingolipid hydroxylase (fatty acid hydroxylase superfamily)